ncbi:MAG: alpha-1,2-fucosyltransferase [Prevotellaceae bacterium]|jgi:hypothetical protein|nr:alpha-1,2-fucosyltransferase [Prevotellaceae bacterium]
MKIVCLQGGLGNQMFQYAFYRYLKTKGRRVVLDASSKSLNFHTGFELPRIFPNIRIENKIIDPYLIRRIKHVVFSNLQKYPLEFVGKDSNINIKERAFHEIVYYGVWAQYDYVWDIYEQLLADFEFIPFNEAQNIAIAEHIAHTFSVSIHIRQGDYHATTAAQASYGDVCTIDYYKTAIKKITEAIPKPVFFVFSDDIDWAKNHLFLDGAFFIDWNKGKNSFRDMQLMTICKHNIIANSTFSWWGAVLNRNKHKIIITPTKFNNAEDKPFLIPDKWIKITAQKN